MVRNQHAANRRALLPRLRSHFAHDLAREESESRRIRRDIRPEHGSVQAIGFDVHANALPENARMLANTVCRVSRARERDYISQLQMIEKIVGRAAKNGQRS